MPRKPSQTLEQFSLALADQLVDQSLRSIARGSDTKVQWRCPIDPRHIWWASPMNRTNAKNPTGCSVCNGKTVIPGINDVATTHPDVAALMVDQSLCTQLTGSSNKRVELWCGNPAHDHWVAALSNVARQGTRCPQCSGRRPIVGQNDLATTHPTLAMQLVDQSLAITLKAGSNTSVLWRCSTNPDHTWKATPYDRTAKKTRCPYCSGRIKLRHE
jgi:DNA-directed RNA polymerase subunit RPC12/RpoP